MHTNAELIKKFYTSFANRDPAGMAECYHSKVEFSDPVFPDLKGSRAAAMWKMLCERGKDLKIEFRDIDADDSSGRAHWEAWYTFSATGCQQLFVYYGTLLPPDRLIRSMEKQLS